MLETPDGRGRIEVAKFHAVRGPEGIIVERARRIG
jgi:hypothetical protein